MDHIKIKQIFSQHKVRPSYHRIRIYQYLLDMKNHPNADMIYQELAKEIPTLSKATVYNTLNLFAEKGLLRILGIVENESRFDADTGLHGHFRCNICGVIRDVHFKADLLELVDMENCIINESHIYFKGCCENCRDYNERRQEEASNLNEKSV